MKFIDNENLKTKVYKSKRNKKAYVKYVIKNLKPTIIDYKKNNKMRLILEFS